MAKINIHGPGNTLHVNMPEERWEEADREKLGLDTIGASGIPFSVSFQGFDSLMCPWIMDTVKQYDNLELLSANFGHALTTHVPEFLWNWEVENGIAGTVPIRFFSEYTHPSNMAFPEEFFFVTQGHYSLHSQARADYLNGTNVYPAAINHRGKIAILMKEPLFGKFLEAFKSFQANPFDQKLLGQAVNEVKKIRDLPTDEIVICPLDPEAPYTGSAFGAKVVWEIFLNAMHDHGLTDVFTKLEPCLDFFRQAARPMPLPPKDLSKWVSYPEQEAWIKHVAKVAKQVSPEQWALLSVGLSSDFMAAQWFKRNPQARVINAVDRQGQSLAINISYNPEIVAAIMLTVAVLENGNPLIDIADNPSLGLFGQRFKKALYESCLRN